MSLIFNKFFVLFQVLFKIKNFWTYFRIYFFPDGKNHQLHFRNGTILLAGKNSSNLGIINEVFFYQDYLKHFKSTNPQIIFDIGANVGYFTIFAKSHFPSAKVYSFEPFAQSFELLNEQIKLNKLSNVFTFKKAVAQKTGTAELSIVGDCGENTLVKTTKAREVSKIETISLEDVFNKENIENCDFLKIDCEGSEYEIFYNLPKHLFSKIKHLAMETHNLDQQQFNREALASFLKNQGLEIIIENLGACPFLFASGRS